MLAPESDREMKAQDRQVKAPRCILRQMKSIRVPSLFYRSSRTDTALVFLGLLLNRSQHRLEILVWHEDQEGGLRISPSEVPKRLIYRRQQRCRTLPDLALSHK